MFLFCFLEAIRLLIHPVTLSQFYSLYLRDELIIPNFTDVVQIKNI